VTDAPDQVESLWRSGDAAGALKAAREALDDGVDRLDMAEALARCAARSRGPEAEAAARLAAKLREEVWPPGDSQAGYAAMDLAEWLRRQGRLEEADSVLERSEVRARASDPTDGLRDVVFTRGKLWHERGQPDQAEAAFLRAAEIDASRPQCGPPFNLPLTELRALYEQQGRHAEAVDVIRRHQALSNRSAVSSLERAILNAHLARALLGAGRPREARAAARQGLKLLEPTADAADSLSQELRTLLAEAKAGAGGGEA
jgi:tetratricopeptide (TPR) repeat protein